MKMFTQMLAFLAPLLCVAADFPPYGAPGDLQCVDIQLVDGPSVKTSCPTYQPDKLYLCSLMNLNNCYANQNGNLVAQQDGGFGKTCRNCKMSGTILTCDCEINSSVPDITQTTSIDTDNAIQNANGNMRCFLRDGTEC